MSLHSPENKSLACRMGCNQTVVKNLFCLSPLSDKYNFTPGNIYNSDETGISTVPCKQIQMLGLRVKKQVGGLSSER